MCICVSYFVHNFSNTPKDCHLLISPLPHLSAHLNFDCIVTLHACDGITTYDKKYVDHRRKPQLLAHQRQIAEALKLREHPLKKLVLGLPLRKMGTHNFGSVFPISN